MSSRINIKSRMSIQKELPTNGREALKSSSTRWRAPVDYREENGVSDSFPASFGQSKLLTEFSLRQHAEVDSDYQSRISPASPTTSLAQSSFSSTTDDTDQQGQFSRYNSLQKRRPGWRGNFNIPTDLPSKNDESDQRNLIRNPSDLSKQLSPTNPGSLKSNYHRGVSEPFPFCEIDREPWSRESGLRRSIFDSSQFRSLRSRKQKELNRLSQIYKQNQEESQDGILNNNKCDNDVTRNSVDSNYNEPAPQTNGMDYLHRSNNIENNITSNNYKTHYTDLTYNDDARQHENELDMQSFNLQQDNKHNSNNNAETFPSLDRSISDEQNSDYNDTTRSKQHKQQNVSTPTSFCETHFDMEEGLSQSDVAFNDDDNYYKSDNNNDYCNNDTSLRHSSQRFSNSNYDDCQRESHLSDTASNDGSLREHKTSRKSENEHEENPLMRDGQKKNFKQGGIKQTVQGFIARLKKVGINSTSTPKMSKDDKILAILLERKGREEREHLEREAAHARWEEEKMEIMTRNSTGRRSLDSYNFKRRNSLGEAIGGKRETSKPRTPNVERQNERRKQVEERLEHNKQEFEEFQNQLKMKLEYDFQRVNSLRSSKSQQNLLKLKLKNLHMEQKQEQIFLQRRKSMENLGQLKKSIESKQIMAEQKVENMKKEETRKSRDDLRSKAEQTKLRLQQLNEEMAQYRAELKEFNEKQLQHADYLAKRTQVERKEAARRERIDKEKMLQENRKRLQEEDEKKLTEKEEVMAIKEKKREQLLKEKVEHATRSRAAARASQQLREEIRNASDITLTVKKLAAFHENTPQLFKRSSDTESMTSAATSPSYLMTRNRSCI